jgi:hypothetical protein
MLPASSWNADAPTAGARRSVQHHQAGCRNRQPDCYSAEKVSRRALSPPVDSGLADGLRRSWVAEAGGADKSGQSRGEAPSSQPPAREAVPPVTDLYHEKSGLLDGDEDSEIDLASYAYQIWKNATDADPSLKKTIPDMSNVVYSSRQRRPEEDVQPGVLVYLKTPSGSDAWHG